MNAFKDEKIKFIAIAVVAVLAFSACLALFSDTSMAEDDAADEWPVSQVTLKIAGDEGDYEVFEYLGVYYVITSEKESEEEVSVFGVDLNYLTDDTPYFVVVCQFNDTDPDEDEDSVCYSVTGVSENFAEFKDRKQVEAVQSITLYLAESVVNFDEGCFSSEKVTFANQLVIIDAPEDVSEADYKEMLSKAGLADGSYIFESAGESITLTFEIGEVKQTVKDNYNKDYAPDYTYEVAFYKGITKTVDECGFSNPYYDLTSYMHDEFELAADAQVTVAMDGKVLVDGDETDIEDKWGFTSQWEENKDYLGDGMYKDWMMWATAAIIIILAIIGLSAFGYRTYLARKG